MMYTISRMISGPRKGWKIAGLVAALAAVLVLAAPVSAQELYKWVGDDGSTHYSSHPPEDREYHVVDMAAGRLSFVDPDENLMRQPEPGDNGESGNGQPATAESTPDPRTMDPAARADYCDELGERLRWLVAGRAEMLTDVYPEEAVRNTESRGDLIEQLAAEIDDNC